MYALRCGGRTRSSPSVRDDVTGEGTDDGQAAGDAHPTCAGAGAGVDHQRRAGGVHQVRAAGRGRAAVLPTTAAPGCRSRSTSRSRPGSGPRPSAVHNAVATQPHQVQGREPRESKPGRSTLFFGGAMQAARAKLTLIRGDGDDGVSFTLAGQDHLAGRGRLPDLVPRRPVPVADPRQLRLRQQPARGPRPGLAQRDLRPDLGPDRAQQRRDGAGRRAGAGGRARGPARGPARRRRHLLLGEHAAAAGLEIRQNLRGGQIGWVHRLAGDTATVGRENNDINFPDDPFISGRHAELKLTGDMLSVTDLGSRNGTFVRVQGERVLRHGDYVFLGQQLLRVEIV